MSFKLNRIENKDDLGIEAVYSVKESTEGRDGITVENILTIRNIYCNDFKVEMNVVHNGKELEQTLDRLALHLELMAKGIRERGKMVEFGQYRKQ